MNIIIGAGPSGLQLGYYFEKHNIEYLILEKSSSCGSFFGKYPHSKQLISINKKYTGNDNKDFNLRHDWNSLLNDDNFNFTEYSDDFYPESDTLHKYFNDFYKKYNLKIVFDIEVLVIKYIDNKFILETKNKNYTCNKLIIATGISKPNIPNYIDNIKNKENIKHYSEFENGFFKDKNKLKNFVNKNVLIVGAGNASYELANILNNYTSHTIITGKRRDLSVVSHYSGDIRSIYLPFLDTFHLKSQNGIDNLSYKELIDKDTSINQCVDKRSANYNKFYLIKYMNIMYQNINHHFDYIIFCTGWKFNYDFFDKSLNIDNENKYPKIDSKFESTEHKNLYFIGTLMHSIDYRISSGSFIHGFRYLIDFFFRCNYLGISKPDKIFNINNDNFFNEISSHIYYRINNSSALYQMFNYIIDVFVFDNITKEINYYENLLFDYVITNNNFLKNKHIYVIKLCYGGKNYDLKRLGEFNNCTPFFLHPEISIFKNTDNNFILENNTVLEENLTASFLDKETYLNEIFKFIKDINFV